MRPLRPWPRSPLNPVELLLSSDAVISEAGVRPSGDWIVHSDADALIEDNNGRLGGSVVVQP